MSNNPYIWGWGGHVEFWGWEDAGTLTGIRLRTFSKIVLDRPAIASLVHDVFIPTRVLCDNVIFKIVADAGAFKIVHSIPPSSKIIAMSAISKLETSRGIPEKSVHDRTIPRIFFASTPAKVIRSPSAVGKVVK